MNHKCVARVEFMQWEDGEMYGKAKRPYEFASALVNLKEYQVEVILRQ